MSVVSIDNPVRRYPRPNRLCVAALVVSAVGLLGCTGDSLESASTSSPAPQVVDTTSPPPSQAISLDSELLTLRGGCNEAAFWAMNPEETVALWLSLDLPGLRDATRQIELPADLAHVELRRGSSLREPMCGDVVTEYHLDSSTKATAGTLTVSIGPSDGSTSCGTDGSLVAENLTFADGTTVGSIQIESDVIGCFAG